MNVHVYDVHSGTTKKCNICDYVTNKTSKLNKHMEVHCKEKRYKCNECDYTCSRRGRLEDHVNFKHRQIRNFMCDQCGRSFTRKENLREHDKIFHEPPIHKCTKCNYASGLKKYLDRHNRRCHGNK